MPINGKELVGTLTVLFIREHGGLVTDYFPLCFIFSIFSARARAYVCVCVLGGYICVSYIFYWNVKQRGDGRVGNRLRRVSLLLIAAVRYCGQVSEKLAHTSTHYQQQTQAVKTINNKHTSVFTLYLITTDRSILRHISS